MSDLDRIFYWQGISENYQNFRGEHTHIPLENRKHLLEVMGVDISSEKALAKGAYELDVSPWQRWLAPLTSVRLSADTNLENTSKEYMSYSVNFKPDDLAASFSWVLKSKSIPSGTIKKQAFSVNGDFTPSDLIEIGDYLFEQCRYSRRQLQLPLLSPGYYDITVINKTDNLSQSAVLAVAPSEAFLPEGFLDQPQNHIPSSIDIPDSKGDIKGDKLPSKKPWGFIVQLYTLRSKTNWGMGDFSDLSNLIRHASKHKADFIGLNPLHALLADIEHNRSPYSPSDRRFINPLYIDIEKLKDARTIDFSVAKNTAQLLTGDSHINYPKVKSLKVSILKACYRQFKKKDLLEKNSRAKHFLSFCKQGGEILKFFAFHTAFSEHIEELRRDEFKINPVNSKAYFKLFLVDACDSQKQSDFLQTHYRQYKKLFAKSLVANVSEHSLQRFIDKNPYVHDIEFHMYLQWVADEQLASCQSLALSSGMSIGLIRDLAVGANGSGAEVKSHPKLFCEGAAVGAPPDPLALQGQNWGLPPMIPSELRESGFEHYIKLLQKNMEHCGALRIDHVMSLMRLWWCPPDKTAEYGAYIYYPLEDLLNILVLESYLNQCIVIGEDLGVVPDEIRQHLAEAKILSNKVFYFEKYPDGAFKHPEHFDMQAFTSINNHDVPTLASWWAGDDIQMRDELNIMEEGSTLEDSYSHRNYEKKQLLYRLDEQGLLPESWRFSINDEDAYCDINEYLQKSIDLTLIKAIFSLAARTHSKLFAVQLEDFLMMSEPVNVPGTFNEYPNWTRKIPVSIDEIFKRKESLDILNCINDQRQVH